MKLKNLTYLLIGTLIFLSFNYNINLLNSIQTNQNKQIQPTLGNWEYFPINGKKIGFWSFFPSGKFSKVPDYSELKNRYGISKICIQWTEHLQTSPFNLNDRIVLCGDTTYWESYALKYFPNAVSYEIDEPLETKHTTIKRVLKFVREIYKINKNTEIRIGVSFTGVNSYSIEYDTLLDYLIKDSINFVFMYSSYNLPEGWNKFRQQFPARYNYSNFINLDYNTNIKELLNYANNQLSLNEIILYCGDSEFTKSQLENFCEQAYFAGWLGRRFVN